MRSCPVGHMFRRVDVRRPGCVVSEFRCRMGGATGPSAPVMAVYVKIASIFVCLSAGVRVSGSQFHSGIHRYVSSFFSVDQIGGGGWGGCGVCRPLIGKCGSRHYGTSTTVPWLDSADGTLRRSVPGVFQLVHRLRRAAVGRFCLDGAK